MCQNKGAYFREYQLAPLFIVTEEQIDGLVSILDESKGAVEASFTQNA